MPAQLHSTSINVADLPALTAAHPVMLSDDDPEMVGLLTMILERERLTVIGTVDPVDTLRLCRTKPISLVVSDISKPTMDGFEMLSRLRGDAVTRAIPVLFLSARCRAEDFETAQRLGAVGYLVKPIRPRELVETVQRVLLTRGRW